MLDPSYEKTFDLITGIFKDLNNLFPDNMLMLGGDEVITSCYKENPKINDFMSKYKIATFDELFQYHLDRSRNILAAINPSKTALYWSNEDTFYLKFKPEDVLLFWG